MTSQKLPPQQKVLKNQTDWQKLYFYRKSVVLYQMTVVFCHRFLPNHGDRTVDQMVQAARSGKQNIVEGHADGVTSTEMELKLLNVARASIMELLEDYVDYLTAHGLPQWTPDNPRYDKMMHFCRYHNDLPEYEPYFELWDHEEMANTAVTLCHMIDKMLYTHLEIKEKDFIEHGGIKERMHAARTGYRQAQDQRLVQLEAAYPQLQAEHAQLQEAYLKLQNEHTQLKEAYAQLQAELKALRKE